MINPYLEVILVVVFFIGISLIRSRRSRKELRRRAKEREEKMKEVLDENSRTIRHI